MCFRWVVQVVLVKDQNLQVLFVPWVQLILCLILDCPKTCKYTVCTVWRKKSKP